MNGKDFKIEMAVLAFALTLSLFLAGFYLYRTYWVDKPLHQAIQNLSGVDKVELKRIDRTTVLTIWLKEKADLKQTYSEVERLAAEFLGDKPYIIDLKDSPDPELNDLYKNLELAIYEGMAKDSFLWLESKMREEAAAIDAVSRLEVDEVNVYITLVRGENSLYRVFRRKTDLSYLGQGGKTS